MTGVDVGATGFGCMGTGAGAILSNGAGADVCAWYVVTGIGVAVGV